jgi:hypothetical protein
MLIGGTNPAACPNHKSTICAVAEAAAPGPMQVSPLVLRIAVVGTTEIASPGCRSAGPGVAHLAME